MMENVKRQRAQVSLKKKPAASVKDIFTDSDDDLPPQFPKIIAYVTSDEEGGEGDEESGNHVTNNNDTKGDNTGEAGLYRFDPASILSLQSQIYH
jgi:hypothetical protein